MNKYALHVAGGALLATTALVSGTVAVNAQATIRTAPAAGATVTNFAPATLTARPLATQMISATTGSAATIGPQAVTIDSTANLFEVTTVLLDVTGAQFATALAAPTVSIYAQTTTGTLEIASSATGANATVTVFSQRVRITQVSAITWSAMVVSGLIYREAQGLATAGTSIALSGSITNAAETSTLESIASRSVVTSVSAANAEVTSGNAVAISNTSNPQFALVSQAGTNGLGNGLTAAAPGNSAILSRVKVTSTLAVSTDLSAALSAGNLLSTNEVKLTHTVLNDPAVVSATLDSAAGGTIQTRTPGQFSAGTVTFGPAATAFANGGNTFVVVNFNGSTPITNAVAGTTATTHVANAPASVAIAGGSGTAVALTRGGLNAQINFVQPSNNAFQSFLRIANTGGTPGAVTITVRSSSTGATLGTYTSPAVSAGGTIQISAANIETQSVPAITPVLGQPYDVLVSGPITGYVQ
ncbi:MAG: hypothetical protein SFV21_04385, partial [Rhodospirillaceae bacterium]|nr:hypothetical protein [Rhodospirillaceae bacterium]